MSQRNDDGLTNVEELPFGADNASLSRWRATTASNANPTTYSEFIADAVTRDRERGLEPIAPSIISDLSAGHKKYLRRYPKLLYSTLVALQLAIGSTIVAVVFVVQDAKRFGPNAGHVIWLVLSAAVGLTLTGIIALLLVKRNERRKRDREMVKGELSKYKREMRKSRMEVEKVGEHGSRLRGEYRRKSREASIRSVSRGRRSRRETVNSTTVGENSATIPQESSQTQTVLAPEVQPAVTEVKRDEEEKAPHPQVQNNPQFPPRSSSLQNFADIPPPVPPKDYSPLRASTKSTITRPPAEAKILQRPNYDLGAHDGGYNTGALDRLLQQPPLSPASQGTTAQGIDSSTSPQFTLVPTASSSTQLPTTHIKPSSPSSSASDVSVANPEEEESFDGEGSFVRRAGHGERGSAQSDENLRANLELDSDAESIGPEHPAWGRRQERSERVVGAWNGVLVPDNPREVEEIEQAGDERVRNRIRNSIEGKR
ncbi:MAG: hypothetical protein M1812_006109 [Candelaria pacifica]|nr:MAG: hypothetical protein M1812_006109 [Candelaria pacifica]